MPFPSSYTTRLTFVTFISSVVASQTYKWPDYQLSGLDENLFQTSAGPPGSLLQTFAPCAGRGSTTISAQWVRIAYHDMAQHNKTSGTGGLDASIRFELGDPMNIGAGMQDSLGDFSSALTPFISMADMIALGTVLGVSGCGGPSIPFKYGRIDATAAGTFDVPEPQQPLQAHLAAFDRQGFNQSEMIALVACGHTLGGVRGKDFPGIIGTDADVVTAFDSTINYDAAVVQEYLNGATKNPLVVGTNATTNSDARIFGSDNNATMRSISAPQAFAATCKSLLQRMVDTVPKDVTLNEPLEPINNKVDVITLYPKDGMLLFNTSLRTLNPDDTQTATLFWEGRNNNPCPEEGCSVQISDMENNSPFLSRIIDMFPNKIAQDSGVTSMKGYFFSTRIPADIGLKNFWFAVKDGSGRVTKVDNGGDGFVVNQDVLLHDPERSFQYSLPDTPVFQTQLRIVVAVRDAIAKATDLKVTLKTYDYRVIPVFKATDPLILTPLLKPDDVNNPPTDGYHFFATNINSTITSLFAVVEAGGQKFETYVQKGEFLTDKSTIIKLPSPPSPN